MIMMFGVSFIYYTFSIVDIWPLIHVDSKIFHCWVGPRTKEVNACTGVFHLNYYEKMDCKFPQSAALN
jgi:hypothetical protein